jgi:hypothetical protein
VKTLAAYALLFLAFIAVAGGLYLYWLGRALCEAPNGTCSEPVYLVAEGLLGVVCLVFGVGLLLEARRDRLG